MHKPICLFSWEQSGQATPNDVGSGAHIETTLFDRQNSISVNAEDWNRKHRSKSGVIGKERHGIVFSNCQTTSRMAVQASSIDETTSGMASQDDMETAFARRNATGVTANTKDRFNQRFRSLQSKVPFAIVVVLNFLFFFFDFLSITCYDQRITSGFHVFEAKIYALSKMIIDILFRFGNSFCSSF